MTFQTASEGETRLVEWPPMHYEPIARMMTGAIEEAEEQGHTVNIYRTHSSGARKIALRRCIERRAAGVVAVYQNGAVLDDLHRELSQYRVPIAILDNSFACSWGIHVASNDGAGCHDAIAHLVALGHRHIAHLSGAQRRDSSMVRAQAFRNAMRFHHLALDDDDLVWSDWNMDAAQIGAQKLLDRPLWRRPSAIFCAGDIIAAGTLRTARRLGLEVPRDLSVIGYGNLQISTVVDPPLTTVEQPFELMGRCAVRHLLDQTGDSPDEEPFEERLPTQLVLRASTAPAPARS